MHVNLKPINDYPDTEELFQFQETGAMDILQTAANQ